MAGAASEDNNHHLPRMSVNCAGNLLEYVKWNCFSVLWDLWRGQATSGNYRMVISFYCDCFANGKFVSENECWSWISEK